MLENFVSRKFCRFRDLRRDVSETYKVLSGILCYKCLTQKYLQYNIEVCYSATWRYSLKIANCKCHYNLRKYSFCFRITNVWNSLPLSVVTAPLVNSFKNSLDSHWALQELRYDWIAELSGTGSRSRVELLIIWVVPLHLLTTIWVLKHSAFVHNLCYATLW